MCQFYGQTSTLDILNTNFSKADSLEVKKNYASEECFKGLEIKQFFLFPFR